MKPAQRRSELVLLTAGDVRLHRLEMPGLLGELPLGEPLAARERQRRDERHVERARAAESGARRRVAARRERKGVLDREHPQRRLEQVQPAVEHEPQGVGALELLSEVLGDQPDQPAAELQLRVRHETNGGVDDEPTLPRGEWRHVRPAAGEVEPHGRGGVV